MANINDKSIKMKPTLIAQDYLKYVKNWREKYIRTPGIVRGEPVFESLFGNRLPKMRTGTHAAAFFWKSEFGEDWVVRFFITQIDSDDEIRYNVLAAWTKKVPYFVEFEYDKDGLSTHEPPDEAPTDNEIFPLIRMNRAAGMHLDDYIEENYEDANTLINLAKEWKKMVDVLADWHIAHGDFQHGNIIISDKGEIRLVDYDGVYHDSLRWISSKECGHPNYKHPFRMNKDYGPLMDDFSALVIYLTIIACAADERCWHNLHKDESDALLFTEDDFKNPTNSIVFSELTLSRVALVRELTVELKKWCQSKTPIRQNRYILPELHEETIAEIIGYHAISEGAEGHLVEIKKEMQESAVKQIDVEDSADSLSWMRIGSVLNPKPNVIKDVSLSSTQISQPDNGSVSAIEILLNDLGKEEKQLLSCPQCGRLFDTDTQLCSFCALSNEGVHEPPIQSEAQSTFENTTPDANAVPSRQESIASSESGISSEADNKNGSEGPKEWAQCPRCGAWTDELNSTCKFCLAELSGEKPTDTSELYGLETAFEIHATTPLVSAQTGQDNNLPDVSIKAVESTPIQSERQTNLESSPPIFSLSIDSKSISSRPHDEEERVTDILKSIKEEKEIETATSKNMTDKEAYEGRIRWFHKHRKEIDIKDLSASEPTTMNETSNAINETTSETKFHDAAANDSISASQITTEARSESSSSTSGLRSEEKIVTEDEETIKESSEITDLSLSEIQTKEQMSSSEQQPGDDEIPLEFECPDCSTLVDTSSSKCPNCGALFFGEEHEETQKSKPLPLTEPDVESETKSSVYPDISEISPSMIDILTTIDQPILPLIPFLADQAIDEMPKETSSWVSISERARQDGIELNKRGEILSRIEGEFRELRDQMEETKSGFITTKAIMRESARILARNPRKSLNLLHKARSEMEGEKTVVLKKRVLDDLQAIIPNHFQGDNEIQFDNSLSLLNAKGKFNESLSLISESMKRAKEEISRELPKLIELFCSENVTLKEFETGNVNLLISNNCSISVSVISCNAKSNEGDARVINYPEEPIESNSQKDLFIELTPEVKGEMKINLIIELNVQNTQFKVDKNLSIRVISKQLPAENAIVGDIESSVVPEDISRKSIKEHTNVGRKKIYRKLK